MQDRNATTIPEVILEALHFGGKPKLIVTDEYTNYRRMIKLTGLSLVLIEHRLLFLQNEISLFWNDYYGINEKTHAPRNL